MKKTYCTGLTFGNKSEQLTPRNCFLWGGKGVGSTFQKKKKKTCKLITGSHACLKKKSFQGQLARFPFSSPNQTIST